MSTLILGVLIVVYTNNNPHHFWTVFKIQTNGSFCSLTTWTSDTWRAKRTLWHMPFPKHLCYTFSFIDGNIILRQSCLKWEMLSLETVGASTCVKACVGMYLCWLLQLKCILWGGSAVTTTAFLSSLIGYAFSFCPRMSWVELKPCKRCSTPEQAALRSV